MNNIFIDDTITHKDIRFDLIQNDNIFINILIPYNCKSELPMHKIWIMIDNTKLIPGERACFMLASSNDVAQIAPVLDPVREAFRFKRRQEYLDALHAGNQLDNRMIPYNTNETQGGFRQSRLQLVGYV